jgi:hypothetical protein
MASKIFSNCQTLKKSFKNTMYHFKTTTNASTNQILHF